MKEIVPSGSWDFQIIEMGRKSEDKNGKFFVRFWHPIMGRWCYVFNGDVIAWTVYYDTRREEKRIYKTISTKNSDKYYIKNVISRNTQPRSNYDIDHFIELHDGKIIAVSVTGKHWFGVSKEEYEDEAWEW